MPYEENRLMASPYTALKAEFNCKPTLLDPAEAPFNSTTGVPEYPGCVVASMVTELVTTGSALNGAMVKGAVPLIWKLMVAAPEAAFALVIAERSDPGPLSAVLVT